MSRTIIEHHDALFPGIDTFKFLHCYDMSIPMAEYEATPRTEASLNAFGSITPPHPQVWLEWSAEYLGPMRQGAHVAHGLIEPELQQTAIAEHYIETVIGALTIPTVRTHYRFLTRVEDRATIHPTSFLHVIGWAMGENNSPFCLHAFGLYLDNTGTAINRALYVYNALGESTPQVVPQLAPTAWCLHALRKFSVSGTPVFKDGDLVLHTAYPYHLEVKGDLLWN